MHTPLRVQSMLKFYGEVHTQLIETINMLVAVDSMEAQGVSSTAVIMLDEVGERLIDAAHKLNHTDNSIMALKSFMPGDRQYLSIRHAGKEVDVKLPHTVLPLFCIFCGSRLVPVQHITLIEDQYDTHISSCRCTCGGEYNHNEDRPNYETT